MNIISNIFKKIKNSDHFYYIFFAFAYSSLIFLQHIAKLNYQQNFLFYDDNLDLVLPQIIKLYQLFKQGIFWGIDFNTLGGSSEFFLRPNLIIYNPIYYISFLFVNYSNIEAAKIAINTIIFLHATLGFYFVQILCVRYFKFSKELAVFCAVSFIFSTNSTYALKYLAFASISYLFPVCLFCLLRASELSFDRKNFSKFFILTLPIFLLYVSGYLALSVSSLFFAVLFAILFVLFIDQQNGNFDYKKITRILAVFLLPSLIVLPYYYASFIFHNSTSGIPSDISSVAYQFSNHILNFLGIFSEFIDSSPMIYEQSFVLGIINLSIIGLFLAVHNKDKYTIGDFDTRLLLASLTIFILIFLSCFGSDSFVSDIFFFIPIIGKMHLYQRHLSYISLFFSIALTIFLKILLKQPYVKAAKAFLMILFVILIFSLLLFSLQLNITKSFLVDQKIIIEIFLCILLFMVMIFFKCDKIIIYSITILMLLSNANFYNYFYKYFNTDYNKKVYLQPEQSNLFKKIISESSAKKAIIKTANLVPNFTVGVFFPKNTNWMLGGKIGDKYISDYYGYELHLSSPVEYLSVVKPTVPIGSNNWNFYPDIDYLKMTGADYVIFSEEPNPYFDKEILQYINPADYHQLSNHIVIAGLNFPDQEKPQFDNGYFKIFSNDKDLQVNNFNTNNANEISLDISSKEKFKLVYEFWPSKSLKFYVNGQHIKPSIYKNLAELYFDPGTYKVEVAYSNPILKLFVIFYFMYWAVLLFVLAKRCLPNSWQDTYLNKIRFFKTRN